MVSGSQPPLTPAASVSAGCFLLLYVRHARPCHAAHSLHLSLPTIPLLPILTTPSFAVSLYIPLYIYLTKLHPTVELVSHSYYLTTPPRCDAA